jgi:GT2 family glycosyltransferase
LAFSALPISAIIPTANRHTVLSKTLKSIARQTYQPDEIIIIDASSNDETKSICNWEFEGLISNLKYFTAKEKGSAIQRQQGVYEASHNFIMFMDDDILLSPDCIYKLWEAINDHNTGGVNALIINQQCKEPGKITRIVYGVLGGYKLKSYAGKCFGPAINLLVNENTGDNDAVTVDWLNTTCTLYRKEVLPSPLFDKNFEGYSFMEDVALSVKVAKNHNLFTIKSAIIYHDSQPGTEKSNINLMAEMELVNRYYIMKHIMGRNGIIPVLQLAGFQLFNAIAAKALFDIRFWAGKIRAIKKIIKEK